jgi:colanic acid biosynthesis glycosyl transferase WcaI
MIATELSQSARFGMMQMRIVIVGSFYEPEKTGIAPYTTGLARYLAWQGHRVTIITGMPSYPEWRIHPEYRGRLRLRESLGGVEIRRTRNYVPRRQTAVHRGLHEASLLLGTLHIIGLPQPDAILGVVPALSAGIVARTVARRTGAPYGLLFQDLTGEGALQSGIGGRRTATAISSIEGWAAREAKVIGVIAEGFRPYLESLGVESQRIRRIRNWVHIDEPTHDRNSIRDRLNIPRDAFVCLHAGNMGFKQGLENIIESARLAERVHPHILFLLMGDGNQRSRLLNLSNRYRLQNLRFLPIQPKEVFSSTLAAADVLLLNQRQAVTNMALPGKLTSYFAAARPIIAAVSPDSETAIEVRRSGGGVLVPPDQPARLVDAVLGLISDPGRQKGLGDAGRHYATTELTADPALARMEGLVQTIADRCANQEIPAKCSPS